METENAFECIADGRLRLNAAGTRGFVRGLSAIGFGAAAGTAKGSLAMGAAMGAGAVAITGGAGLLIIGGTAMVAFGVIQMME